MRDKRWAHYHFRRRDFYPFDGRRDISPSLYTQLYRAVLSNSSCKSNRDRIRANEPDWKVITTLMGPVCVCVCTRYVFYLV